MVGSNEFDRVAKMVGSSRKSHNPREIWEEFAEREDKGRRAGRVMENVRMWGGKHGDGVCNMHNQIHN